MTVPAVLLIVFAGWGLLQAGESSSCHGIFHRRVSLDPNKPKQYAPMQCRGTCPPRTPKCNFHFTSGVPGSGFANQFCACWNGVIPGSESSSCHMVQTVILSPLGAPIGLTPLCKGSCPIKRPVCVTTYGAPGEYGWELAYCECIKRPKPEREGTED